MTPCPSQRWRKSWSGASLCVSFGVGRVASCFPSLAILLVSPSALPRTVKVVGECFTQQRPSMRFKPLSMRSRKSARTQRRGLALRCATPEVSRRNRRRTPTGAAYNFRALTGNIWSGEQTPSLMRIEKIPAPAFGQRRDCTRPYTRASVPRDAELHARKNRSGRAGRHGVSVYLGGEQCFMLGHSL